MKLTPTTPATRKLPHDIETPASFTTRYNHLLGVLKKSI